MSRVGALVLKDVPAVPEEVVEELRRYQNTRSASVRGWLGDELLIATRFAETTQLHRLEAPGAARRQLTFFAEPVVQAYVPPGAANGFIYARDVGGS